jgi:hypothetical protein
MKDRKGAEIIEFSMPSSPVLFSALANVMRCEPTGHDEFAVDQSVIARLNCTQESWPSVPSVSV